MIAWGDGNGRSHSKVAHVGPSLTIPIMNGNHILGTWQQIILIECDTKGKNDGKVVITVMGTEETQKKDRCRIPACVF